MLALLWLHITRHLIQSTNTMTALTANHPLSATNKLLSKTTKYPQAFVLEIQNISSVASKHSSLGVISVPEPQCIALPLTLVKKVSWLYSKVHYSIHSLPRHDCNTDWLQVFAFFITASVLLKQPYNSFFLGYIGIVLLSA